MPVHLLSCALSPGVCRNEVIPHPWISQSTRCPLGRPAFPELFLHVWMLHIVRNWKLAPQCHIHFEEGHDLSSPEKGLETCACLCVPLNATFSGSMSPSGRPPTPIFSSSFGSHIWGLSWWHVWLVPARPLRVCFSHWLSYLLIFFDSLPSVLFHVPPSLVTMVTCLLWVL